LSAPSYSARGCPGFDRSAAKAYGLSVLPFLIVLNWLLLSVFTTFFMYCCSVVSDHDAEERG
jgi:hypothetical protein